MLSLYWIINLSLAGLLVLKRFIVRKSDTLTAEINLSVMIGAINLALSFLLATYWIFVQKFLGVTRNDDYSYGFITFLFYLILADFIFYQVHWIMHKYHFLWKFHQVHHQVTEVNFESHFRHAPQTLVFSTFFVVIFSLIFKLHPEILFTSLAFVNLYQFFVHSQTKLWPKRLSYLFITPQLHCIHHEAGLKYYNLGGIFSIWDRLFRTFQAQSCKESEKQAVYGLN